MLSKEESFIEITGSLEKERIQEEEGEFILKGETMWSTQKDCNMSKNDGQHW